MDARVVLVCIFLYFQGLVYCAEPDNFKETCVDLKRPEKITSFELSCDGDSVITYVNATLGVGSCKLEMCVGDTPSFIVQLHACYWKNKCTVTMPTDDYIVKMRSQNDRKCVGRTPTFMRLHNVRCFKPYATGNNDKNARRIIDICHEKEIAFGAGIIKSHENYPWDYGRGGKDCPLHMYVRIGQPLTITVQETELGEYDTLVITADGIVTNLTDQQPEYSQLVSNEGSAVDIIYKTDGQTNGGLGFLMCFSFNDVSYLGTNACDAVTTTGSLRRVKLAVSNVIPDPFEEIKQTTQKPAEENCKRRRRNGKCRKRKKKNDRRSKRDREKDKNKRRRGKRVKRNRRNNK